jgi:DNA end-binding protein Ku
MWRGAIQFGLVTIPVKLYLATEARGGLSFNLLHKEDMQRIGMKVHCPEHGEISRSDTVRGYEWSKDSMWSSTRPTWRRCPPTVRAIETEQFVPPGGSSTARSFVRQAYYVEPEPVPQGVPAARTVLADSELPGHLQIVLEDREQLAALDPFASTMLLSTLYWPDEVRELGEPDVAADEMEFKPAELAMARQLVETLTGAFDASQYRDEYREALLRVIDAKVAGQPMQRPSEGRDGQADRPDGGARASVAAAAERE